MTKDNNNRGIITDNTNKSCGYKVTFLTYVTEEKCIYSWFNKYVIKGCHTLKNLSLDP